MNFELGERRFLYQYKWLFDSLLIIENQVKDDGSSFLPFRRIWFDTGIIRMDEPGQSGSDYVLSKYLLLQTHVSYSFWVWRVVNPEYYGTRVDDSHPYPYFGGLNFELHTCWGFFTGLDHNVLINRCGNPNNTKWLDILIGFHFPV